MTTTQEAQALGAERGKADGSHVIDGNVTIPYCQKILAGYNDGDPEIMDMCPAPLSGEWAGSSISEIFGTSDPVAEIPTEILDAYEQSYTDAWWDTVLASVAYHLPEDDHTLE